MVSEPPEPLQPQPAEGEKVLPYLPCVVVPGPSTLSDMMMSDMVKCVLGLGLYYQYGLRYMANFGSFTPKPMQLLGTPEWLPQLQVRASVIGKALRKSICNLVLKRQYKVTNKKGKKVTLDSIYHCRLPGWLSCELSSVCWQPRSGGKDLKSTGAYPRSFGDYIAVQHKKAS